MKPAVLLLWLNLLLITAHAQPLVRIDSLATGGLLLEHGWRWRAGDKLAWAAPSIDASRWDTVGDYPRVDELPGFRKTNIGWLRLSFSLDSAVATQSLSIRLVQLGASQVYLDGKLLREYGKIGPAGQVILAATAPQGDYELLPPLSAGLHVLAVRLAHQSIAWYEPSRIDQLNSTFLMWLLPTQGLTQRHTIRTLWETAEAYWLAGFFLALAGVHAFYFAYRRTRISLIFSLTMVLGATYFLVRHTVQYVSDQSQTNWLSLAYSSSLTGYFISLLLTYYLYLHRRPGPIFWSTAVAMLTNVFLTSYTTFSWVNYIFSFGLAMLLTQGMFLSISAIKTKSSDGWIVMGSLVTLILLLTSQLVVDVVFEEAMVSYAQSFADVTNVLFFITVPLTLALLLARESAQTNSQLALNLAEVKQLSADKEAILTQQKAFLAEQVAARTAELSQSLAELQATQQQLVQREKMASLGELTAGIAHEIQNPLNFVNNFTEVSTELVDEIREERGKPVGQRDEGLEVELLGDLTQNLSKISHHGKRAAGIVRGMLEHSRNSTGQRDPTDINALADEYLRLSYHGWRRSGVPAKDKSVNARLVTDYDASLPLLSIVSQDIGRVLLNLFNNAFYAVHQRTLTTPTDYEPTVSVSTKATAGGVEIRVSDNGTGIPAGMLDKVFQPFFTTKPTGEGTGLGLSLSYDIVTKGHGGTMHVDAVEGEGSTFVVVLKK